MDFREQPIPWSWGTGYSIFVLAAVCYIQRKEVSVDPLSVLTSKSLVLSMGLEMLRSLALVWKNLPDSSTALTHASLHASTHAEAKHVENAPESNLDDF